MSFKTEEEWYRTFYEGTFFVKGWKHRMKEILQMIQPDDRERIAELLEGLGRKIGYEWAKDNNVRRIDSAMLKQWGGDLHMAGERGADVLIEKIRTLSNEVEKILS
jgi:putative sterol carrier protein